MIKFAREILFEVVEDIQPLLEAHYQELCLDKGRMKLDPMWERYAHIEANGRDALQIFTARTDDHTLVGYAAFFVAAHLHYRELFPAINDVIWVSPEHRGSVGLRLVHHCERELAPFAHKIVWHVKPGTPMAKLLAHEKLGYRLDEQVFGKFL